MKKSVMLVLGILTGMLVVVSMAFAAGTGIKGTAHDLSTHGSGAWAGDGTEQTVGKDRICVYCHAPHHTKKGTDLAGLKYYPLCNHTVTSQTYVMYNNGTELPSDQSHQSQAAAALVGKNQPGSVSRLCLSCHDGTIATNSYGDANRSASVGAGDKNIVSSNPNGKKEEYLIGGNGDLSNHHPIGFNYANVAAADNEIAKTNVQFTGTIYAIGDLLWQGNMECTTCHDVHNTKNLGEKFLWISDSKSQFCLTCHLKGVGLY